ncbi:MAG: hypothetical protein JSV11_08030 [Nitrospiraceae bacterium]|nr:MAG: hypothetical protein JSV11_08030 [Nitrospiraceae bacterium]
MRIFYNYVLVTLVCVAAGAVCAQPVSSGDDREAEESILDAAETFFVSLKDSDFHSVWTLLSKKSRTTIINDVYTASEKMDMGVTKEAVIEDFERRGTMFNNYWNSFRGNIDIDLILEQSQWQMSEIHPSKTEIIISHKKSPHPTRLKLFKEHDQWKVGLTETFWVQKALRVLQYILL